jgi:hypothetical protein
MNGNDTESEGELRAERNELDDRLWIGRQVNIELCRSLRAQAKYIAELEKQLEPSVITEIREELEARNHE